MIEGAGRARGAEHRQRQAGRSATTPAPGPLAAAIPASALAAIATPILSFRSEMVMSDCGEHRRVFRPSGSTDQRNSHSSDRYFQLMK